MRTTLEIPDDLLEEARRAIHARTLRETVIAGLEELVRRAKREALRGLAGRLDLDLDVGRSRGRRPRR